MERVDLEAGAAERRLLESLFFTAHLLCVNIWLSDQLRSLLDWEYI